MTDYDRRGSARRGQPQLVQRMLGLGAQAPRGARSEVDADDHRICAAGAVAGQLVVTPYDAHGTVAALQVPGLREVEPASGAAGDCSRRGCRSPPTRRFRRQGAEQVSWWADRLWRGLDSGRSSRSRLSTPEAGAPGSRALRRTSEFLRSPLSASRARRETTAGAPRERARVPGETRSRRSMYEPERVSGP